MKLYDNAFSPFARKVRLVLDHKRLAYDAVDALEPGAHEMLAAVNPRVEVTVLDDDGIVVVNSADIVAYLDHRYPAQPVLPADPALRVRARALERLADTLIDAILHDVSIWLWPTLGRTDSPPAGLREAAQRLQVRRFGAVCSSACLPFPEFNHCKPAGYSSTFIN